MNNNYTKVWLPAEQSKRQRLHANWSEKAKKQEQRIRHWNNDNDSAIEETAEKNTNRKENTTSKEYTKAQ